MGKNPSRNKIGGLQCPVEFVTWKDCQAFIARLNSLTGETFRLPTEAEWEFAARGGNMSKGYKYSGSNRIDDVAWYEKNSTQPVKLKQANELGIYDMSGDVWEWCADCLGRYSSSAQTDPTGPSSGSRRVLRGGSYHGIAKHCRVAFRNAFGPGDRRDYVGLRLAR